MLQELLLQELQSKGEGCVGWFLDMDADCDGFVSPIHIIDAVLQLNERLSGDEAARFVATIPSKGDDGGGEVEDESMAREPEDDMAREAEDDCITLPCLWIAMHCPHIQDGGWHEYDADADDSHAQAHQAQLNAPPALASLGEGYIFHMPNLSRLQFDTVFLFKLFSTASKILNMFWTW